jgi:hypothetical protein
VRVQDAISALQDLNLSDDIDIEIQVVKIRHPTRAELEDQYLRPARQTLERGAALAVYRDNSGPAPIRETILCRGGIRAEFKGGAWWREFLDEYLAAVTDQARRRNKAYPRQRYKNGRGR